MYDYYKLFDYCKKLSEDKNLKIERVKKNKESKQKKQLFRIITENGYENIKNSVDKGNDFTIIYDSEYNRLIDELMDSFIHHFKPFNVVYKKKCFVERGIFEILKDETNYILIIDWNINKNNNNIYNNKITDKQTPDKINIIKNINVNGNEILDKKKNEIDNDEINIIIEKKNDTFLEKIGFEAIF